MGVTLINYGVLWGADRGREVGVFGEEAVAMKNVRARRERVEYPEGEP